MKLGSRIDAYLTNVTFPWEKQSDSHVTVGALIVYRVIIEGDDYKFERLWVKSFNMQVILVILSFYQF